MKASLVVPLTGLALVLVAGCGVRGAGAPASEEREERAMALVKAIVTPGRAYQTQSLEPLSAASIKRLAISVSRITPEGEVPELDGSGAAVKATLTARDLGDVIRVTGLHTGVQLRFRCQAYGTMGTDDESLISTDDASSATDVLLTQADSAVPIQLRVRLRDIVYDAKGVAWGIGVRDGSLIAAPPVAVSAQGVSDLAGSSRGYMDGSADVARFDTPYGIACDGEGNAYVADAGNRRVRRIDAEGEVSTYSHFSATAEPPTGSPASPVGFANGLAFSQDSDLFLADSVGGVIARPASGSLPSVLVGNGLLALVDGPGTWASFDLPTGVVAGPDGSILVADTLNNCIRFVTWSGYTFTWVGNGDAGDADGAGAAARFNHPTGLARDAAGSVYVCDTDNNKIRKIDPEGNVSTIAGVGEFGDNDGPARQARFDGPTGIAVDADGLVYVADTNNNCVRRITPSGSVLTFSGSGIAGHKNGSHWAAQFNSPSGLALDGRGNLLVADTLNNRVRKLRIRGDG